MQFVFVHRTGRQNKYRRKSVIERHCALPLACLSKTICAANFGRLRDSADPGTHTHARNLLPTRQTKRYGCCFHVRRTERQRVQIGVDMEQTHAQTANTNVLKNGMRSASLLLSYGIDAASSPTSFSGPAITSIDMQNFSMSLEIAMAPRRGLRT